MKVRETKIITVQDYETANDNATDFNLTPGRKYKVLGFNGDCIKVKNDLGDEEWYSIEYFIETCEV